MAIAIYAKDDISELRPNDSNQVARSLSSVAAKLASCDVNTNCLIQLKLGKRTCGYNRFRAKSNEDS